MQALARLESSIFDEVQEKYVVLLNGKLIFYIVQCFVFKVSMHKIDKH